MVVVGGAAVDLPTRLDDGAGEGAGELRSANRSDAGGAGLVGGLELAGTACGIVCCGSEMDWEELAWIRHGSMPLLTSDA